MDHEEARKRLNGLVENVPGMLKIITSQCVSERCGGSLAGPHDESERSIYDPKHFVIHDVVRIEERNGGCMRAYSREGDWCEGLPADLLTRLLEASGLTPQSPIREMPAAEKKRWPW